MCIIYYNMQISDVSQCVQIELQERDALKANLIALVWCACRGGSTGSKGQQ